VVVGYAERGSVEAGMAGDGKELGADVRVENPELDLGVMQPGAWYPVTHPLSESSGDVGIEFLCTTPGQRHYCVRWSNARVAQFRSRGDAL
jgi:hypothetical protein